MIKLVKKPIKFVTQCYGCGCIFEYELDDINTDGHYITCPNCNGKQQPNPEKEAIFIDMPSEDNN